MASHISVLDIQGDSLRLLSSSETPPGVFRKALPPGLMHQGRATDPDVLAFHIRCLFRENKIPFGRCVLILPRELVTLRQAAEQLPVDPAQSEIATGNGFTTAILRRDLTDFRAILRKAGLSPVCALPREAACQALAASQKSACLVMPEGGRWQAVFFHGGRFQMGRTVDTPQELTRILQIYRFSNPDAPPPRVYLPRDFPDEIAGDWEIRPLSDLLTKELPAEIPGSFPFRADFNPKRMLCTVGLALAVLVSLYGGIFAPLQERTRAKAELACQQQLASQLEARLSGYDSLAAQYLRIGGGILTEAELAMADRTALLDLVEQVICPRAAVTELTLSGNSLTLHLTEISLEAAGVLVSELKGHPLIDQAQLHSAEADFGKNADIFLRITLKEGEP